MTTSLLARVRRRALAELLGVVLPIAARSDLVRLGSDYGGYAVPTSLPDDDWVCYSAGIGEDLSFDLELIDRFGCSVVAFDPTPRALTYAGPVAARTPGLRVEPYGLWTSDGDVAFFPPRDPDHVSHSITNLQRTDRPLLLPVRSLRSITRSLSHHTVDLLKLDIEGAEHAVVADLLAGPLRPTVICMEIDQPSSVMAVRRTFGGLRRAGYAIVDVEGWTVTLVHRADGR